MVSRFAVTVRQLMSGSSCIGWLQIKCPAGELAEIQQHIRERNPCTARVRGPHRIEAHHRDLLPHRISAGGPSRVEKSFETKASGEISGHGNRHTPAPRWSAGWLTIMPRLRRIGEEEAVQEPVAILVAEDGSGCRHANAG